MSRVLVTSLGRVKCRGFSLCSAVRLLPVFWRWMCTLGPWAMALFSGCTASPGIRLRLCRGWGSLLCRWGLRFAIAPQPPVFPRPPLAPLSSVTVANRSPGAPQPHSMPIACPQPSPLLRVSCQGVCGASSSGARAPPGLCPESPRPRP